MQQHPLVAILTRLGMFMLVMMALSIMIFVLARVVPGDPARMALGPAATQEQVDALRQQMGLNRPLPVQYLDYANRALQGDLGMSLVSQRPVTTDLSQTVPATVELVLVSVIFMFAVAIPLGVITAHYRNRIFDYVGRFLSLTGVTIPSFLFAITMQLIAARYLTDWPIIGRLDHGLNWQGGPTGFLLIDGTLAGRFDVVLNALKHLALPAFALSMAGIGQITRITRSSMLENQRKDHVLTLKSFGVPERVIIFRYLLKLSSIAPLTIMGLEFASLIGNAFVIEMIFAWGGFASYGLTSILQKDLNAVTAVVLVAGLFFIIANLIVDVVISIIDPRLRRKEAR
ncbi:ABC transporter permease [Agrobacterium sp. a22-2]|uniref:ABC transporter permease n=1 Tax=Agrobacterium sp. a22-2 TaxID=2283840 RepID=UPI00144515F3|nr:ABC transporter permease [Agrobacterium sp. a22-2]NKN38875.1 ABC transporter permease [Agrobacterium sp. a22-2]